MSITAELVRQIPNCVGAADNNDGTYRLDFADGTDRLATDAEVLQAAKTVRIRALEVEKEAYVRTLYSDQVVQDAALGIPSIAFRDQVIADRTQCAADLATAIAAVNAATEPADALAVPITWAVTR